MSFFDFIVDLMWGTSEIFIARREDKKRGKPGGPEEDALARANRQDGELSSEEKREVLDQELADRVKAARIIGNKTT
jgi:hypothetical protein